MDLLNRMWRSNVLIRLRSWEYWPFEIVYFPIFGYWLWLSLKARSFLFFSASNPGIENGGMLGESKIKILEKIPEQFKPKTIYFKAGTDNSYVIDKMESLGLTFPVICKPDVGERGWQVERVTNQRELALYIQKSKVGFLVQEYIDLPVEVGVFYYRHPQQKHGTISSMVIKEMLYVRGNGTDSLEKLIQASDRAKLQWAHLKVIFKDELENVLANGATKELISIGNHCKGTKFINANHLIDDELHRAFDDISNQIEGFFYGRFDLRTASIEALKKGSVQIMELNGAGAEPSHIYHPGFSMREGIRILFHHWKILYEISVANHNLGVPYLSLRQGWSEYKKLKALNKL